MRYSHRRTLRTLPEENRMFGKGGWFKNNWGDIAKTVAGGAMMATGVGAGAGAGLMAGGVSGLLTNEPEMPTQDTQNNYAILNRQSAINNRSSIDPIFFNKGGVMSQVPGGVLRQSASNAAIATGKSHEEGGIQLPGGEIEGNETIVQSPFTGKTQIHSDELGTSEYTNRLVRQKGKLEEQLAQLNLQLQTINNNRNEVNDDFNTETNRLKRNSYTRDFAGHTNKMEGIIQNIQEVQQNISDIDKEIEALFNQQQQINGNSNGEQEFQLGGNMDNPPTEDEMFYRERAFDMYSFPGYYPSRQSIKNTSINPNNGINYNTTEDELNKPKPDVTVTNNSSNNSSVLTNTPKDTEGIDFKQAIDDYNYMQDVPRTFLSNANSNTPYITKSVDNSKIDLTGVLGEEDLNINDIPVEQYSRFKHITGKAGNIAESLVPYADNIFNAIAGNKLSNIPKPSYNKTAIPTIDPYYNINPQLNNMQSQTASYKDFVRSNTNNSAVARASISASRASNIDQINELYAQKDNIERQTIGRNLNVGMQIDARNNQAQYQNDMFNYQADVAGIERESANVANAISKFIAGKTQDNMLDSQKETLIELMKGIQNDEVYNDLADQFKLDVPRRGKKKSKTKTEES